MRLNQHKTTQEDHARARELRRNATPAERKLWVALRGAAEKHGLKFRRQAVIRPFIADFACMKARLLIELDGYSHDVNHGYDEVRDAKLKEAGYHMLRFNNEDVNENIDGVVSSILHHAVALIQNQGPCSASEAPTPRGATTAVLAALQFRALPQGEGESPPGKSST
ncbi:MAG: DUF559 domain-containing protein [Alphaproteobacteria bacterium]|nr:DUF559 domain-containing protein [Alphaproteobacteria bacterium]